MNMACLIVAIKLADRRDLQLDFLVRYAIDCHSKRLDFVTDFVERATDNQRWEVGAVVDHTGLTVGVEAVVFLLLPQSSSLFLHYMISAICLPRR